MDIARIAALGIVAAILAVAVKRQSAEFALLISISASVLLLLILTPWLGQAVGILENIASLVNAASGAAYIGLILKIICVAYIAEFASQVCADAGESAIASKIELGGKVIIMVISAPIISGLVSLIAGIL
ncbi:MAG: stage III sporulation protein AD [Firmicutes bacterium]|nr:stage III sporulation protein AD [Bacillota bacterium]